MSGLAPCNRNRDLPASRLVSSEEREKAKRESGFTTHFSGANAKKQPVRIRRRDVQLLRKSIEGSLPQSAQPSERGRWEIRTNATEYPEVPDTDADGNTNNDDDHTAAIIEMGEKVRMLPIIKKDRIMQLITNFESSNANEDDHLTEINNLITRFDEHSSSSQSSQSGPTPDWLDDKQMSPVKRSTNDNQLFCPQTSGRPTSGRRARTPAGYSSTPSSAFGKGPQPGPGSIARNVSENSVLNPSRKSNLDTDILAEYAEKVSLTKRPSYEDPLDVLQKQQLKSERDTATPPPSNLMTARVQPKRTSLTPPAGSLAEPEVSADFSIPTLPEGRILTVNCLDTWGDPHYIGINSIEMFDGDGEQIRIRDPMAQVSGNPASINILPEYNNDPRVVQNVVDGVSRTCDDIHVWLAPFTPNSDHIITIDMKKITRLSMLRFWNYNKSRPHSFRGVKDIEVQLDGHFIFKGEISKAPGILQGSEDQTEIILFTIDQHILSRIDEVIESQHEMWRKEDIQNPAELMQTISRPTTSHGADSRPGTTARGRGGVTSAPSGVTHNQPQEQHNTTNIPKGEVVIIEVLEWWDPQTSNSIHAALNELQFLDASDAVIRYSSTPMSANRYKFDLKQPTFVSAVVIKNAPQAGIKRLGVTVDEMQSSPEGGLFVKLNTSFAAVPQKLLLSTRRAKNLPKGRVIALEILTNWGDMQNVGFGGVEFLSEEGDVLPAVCGEVSKWPWSVSHELAARGPLSLTFTLEREASVCSVRFYNFNESLATTPRGVKRLRVHVNNILASPQSGHYIRKAPGTASGSPFTQTIQLSTLQRDFNSTVTGSTMNKQVADAVTRARLSSKPFPKELLDVIGYEPPLFPAAHVFRLELTGTHGDQYYVGLNGIELFDVRNQKIPLDSNNVEAIPRDITVLPNNRNDLRVLPNLVDGVNSSSDDNHIWLAPYLPGTVSLVYVIFEEPVAVSRIAVWNYSKTPSRGAQSVTVYADESVIYSGSLKRAPDIGSESNTDFSQHMIFTNDASVIGLDIVQSNPSSQDSSGGVLFYDSGKISALEEEMPQTSCGRPATMSQRPSLAGNRAAGYRGTGG